MSWKLKRMIRLILALSAFVMIWVIAENVLLINKRLAEIERTQGTILKRSFGGKRD